MTSNEKRKEAILETALKRFRQAEEAEYEQRQVSLEDLRFRAGDQWLDQIKRQRDADNRPCLTINRFPQFIRQITNDQRQNRPAIRVSPVDNGADKDTARILQGLIRHIEYDSNADAAYDSAFEGACNKGFGYYRVVTEYSSPYSFNQDIKIKKVRDDFSVYLDPGYQESDGSDAKWGFVFEDIPVEDYEMLYGKSDMATMDQFRGIGDSEKSWVSNDYIRVAEYFYIEYKEDEVLFVRTDYGPVSMLLSDLKDDEGNWVPEFDPSTIIDRRKTQIPTVKWCKINAVDILEERDWAGRWIPIIPVLGDWLEVDGKKILEGVIRHAKDPQRMLNYWKSSETEAIALAPRAPWLVAEGQIGKHKKIWETANTRNHAYLPYIPKSLDNGTPVPIPQRNTFEPAVSAITQAAVLAGEDLKTTTGIYDAALGHRSNETSGRAIHARTMQTQTSNFHFIDNLSRSLKHTGRILVDLIPKIYDTQRSLRIIGEDGSEEIININQVVDGDEESKVSFSHGKYDVTVSTGPSFATKRQEAAETMLEFMRVYPASAPIIADLMVANMDWQGSDEVAERLKKALPPEYQEDANDKEPIPAHVQQKLIQMSKAIELLTQELNEKSEMLDKDIVKAQLQKYKVDTDRDVKLAEIESEMRIAQVKEQGIDDRYAFDQEIKQLDKSQSNYHLKEDYETQQYPGDEYRWE